MYISRIRLENIRGFSGRRGVDLTFTRPDGSHAGWTVLAGLNGSGKTSLLRAIALAISGPYVAASLMQDFRTWMTVGQRQATARVNLSPDPAADYWPGPGTARGAEVAVTLRWAVATDRETSRPGAQPVLTGDASPHTAQGPWQADPIGWFCAGYGPFRRLVGGAAEAQRLMVTPGPVARLASLFHEDASLTEGVQWLIDQHLRAPERQGGRDAGSGRDRPRAAVRGCLPGHAAARRDAWGGDYIRRLPGNAGPLARPRSPSRTVQLGGCRDHG
jgi:hypothetical protein